MLATEFKIAMLEKLRAGEVVNLFDLGVMYLTATGSIDAQSPTAAECSRTAACPKSSAVRLCAVPPTRARATAASRVAPRYQTVFTAYFGMVKSRVIMMKPSVCAAASSNRRLRRAAPGRSC